MATATKFNKDGSEAGSFDLPEYFFGAEINEALIHDAVVMYLANQRQGDASTKERSDVRGGGRKPYRQKGTGRARAGTIRSPIFRGGGVVFGPHPRSYRKDMPKKAKRLALRSSLTSRANAGDVHVIDELKFDEPSTKSFANVLKNMNNYERKVLIVTDARHEGTHLSGRNIPGVRMTHSSLLNTYDVMWADKIVLTSGAIAKMEEVFKT